MAASELPEKLWFLIFIHCSKVSAVTDELLGKNTRCLQLFAGRHFKEICLTSAVIWVFHSPNTENFMHTSFFMEEFIEFQLCILTGQMHKGNMVCVTLIFSQKQYFPSVKSVIVASSYIGGLPAIHCRNALVKGVFWKNKQTKDQTACNSFLRAQLTECLVLIRVVSWIFQSPHRDHPGHTCFFMDGFRVRYCRLLQQGKNKETCCVSTWKLGLQSIAVFSTCDS